MKNMLQPELLAKVWTISELNESIRQQVSKVGYVWVSGELSNVKVYKPKGHIYCSLKDSQAVLKACIFNTENIPQELILQDGMQVLVYGRVNYYVKGGEINIIIDYIEPKGLGVLYLKFLALKEKLEKEGLFEEGHKKPLPLLPRRIGLITSVQGAAIRDMLRVMLGKFPKTRILIYPAQVQGEKASFELCEAIRFFNERREDEVWGVDVLVLGRGGGSLEDLWAFNEERLARAIYESVIPVVSAVGHEVDVTISDLVADVRAPTPTKAGELVVPDAEALEERLDTLLQSLSRHVRERLEWCRQRLERYSESHAFGKYADLLIMKKRDLDQWYDVLQRGLDQTLKDRRNRLEFWKERLEGMNPDRILKRGYSITREGGTGKIIKTVRGVSEGAVVTTRVADGEFQSVVCQPGKKVPVGNLS